jgi:hypothetical protein
VGADVRGRHARRARPPPGDVLNGRVDLPGACLVSDATDNSQRTSQNHSHATESTASASLARGVTHTRPENPPCSPGVRPSLLHRESTGRKDCSQSGACLRRHEGPGTLIRRGMDRVAQGRRTAGS